MKKGALIGLIAGLSIAVLPIPFINLIVRQIFNSYIFPILKLIPIELGESLGIYVLLFLSINIILYSSIGFLIGWLSQERKFIILVIVVLVIIGLLIYPTYTLLNQTLPDIKQGGEDYSKREAIRTKDIQGCNRLSNDADKSYCSDKVYNSLGQTEKNLSYCENIIDPELKNVCIYNTILKIGNEDKEYKVDAPCHLIEEEVTRKDCERWSSGMETHFQATNRIEFECEKLSNLEKDNCIFDITKQTFEPDKSFCNLIIDSRIKEDCLKFIS